VAAAAGAQRQQGHHHREVEWAFRHWTVPEKEE
jgi:hypothetical protein